MKKEALWEKAVLWLVVFVIVACACFLRSELSGKTLSEFRLQRGIFNGWLTQSAEDSSLSLEEIVTEEEEALLGDDYERLYVEATTAISYQRDYVSTWETLFAAQAQLSGISIFNKTDSSTKKSMEKEQEDFSVVFEVEIVTGSGGSQAVTAVLEDTFYPYLAVVYVIGLIFLIQESAKSSWHFLLFSTPGGRKKLALRRIVVLLLWTVLGLALSYAVLLFFACLLYGGFGDFGMAVQSVSLLQNVTYKLSLGQFLLLYVGYHAITLFSLVMLIWLLIVLLENRPIALFAFSGVVFAEYLFFSGIDAQGKWNLLKYVNLFCWLAPVELFRIYRNLSLLGTLIQAREVAILLAFAVILIAAALLTLCYERRSREGLGALVRLGARAITAMENRISGLQSRLSVAGAELYRNLVMQKGLLLMLAVLIFLIVGTNRTTLYYSSLNQFLISFYEEYEGIPDESVQDYLTALETEIEEAEERYASKQEQYRNGEITSSDMIEASFLLQAYDIKRQALEFLTAELEELALLAEEKGIEAWLINSIGYKYLFSSSSYSLQTNYGMLALLLVVLIAGGGFLAEGRDGTKPLLFATPGGRERLFVAKRQAALTGCLITLLFLTAYEVGSIWLRYGLYGWLAPIQSLSYFREFSLALPLWGLLLFVFLVRAAFLYMVSGLVCTLSIKIPADKSLFVGLLVLVAPSALYLWELNWAAPFALARLYSVTGILQTLGFVGALGVLVLFLVLGALFWKLCRSAWLERQGDGLTLEAAISEVKKKVRTWPGRGSWQKNNGFFIMMRKSAKKESVRGRTGKEIRQESKKGGRE